MTEGRPIPFCRREFRMKKANIVTGCIFIALGGYVLFTTAGYPQNLSAYDPGAAYFPGFAAWLVIALSAALIVMSVMGKGADVDQPFVLTPSPKQLGIGLGLFVLYCILLPGLGFIIDTIWFCFACMYLLQNRKYLQMALVSIGIGIGIYVLFAMVLGAKLPAGLLKGIL